jgi:hypothetical protein
MNEQHVVGAGVVENCEDLDYLVVAEGGTVQVGECGDVRAMHVYGGRVFLSQNTTIGHFNLYGGRAGNMSRPRWIARVHLWWQRRRRDRYDRERDAQRVRMKIEDARREERLRVLMIAREQLGLHNGEAWQDVHAHIVRAASE